jgi:hypothetical protein
VGPLALKPSLAEAVDLSDAGELTLAGGDDNGAPWVMRYDANGTPAILTSGTQPLEYCE